MTPELAMRFRRVVEQIDELARSGRNVIAPEPAGMLGRRESLLCYLLARDVFEGTGTIVDAGSFLGKSACYFSYGLRANPRYSPGRHRIHCFDNFQVNEDHTIEFIRSSFGRSLTVGDSTRDLFDQQVSPVREMLEVHSGDFHTVSWRAEPIELLFVDIAKSVSLCRRVSDVFFPNLIPGRSTVVQQDYHHPWLPHIHVTMEYLSDHFEIVIPRTDDSAVFQYLSAITAPRLARAIAYDFTPEEELELMNRAIARLEEDDRYYVELARIVLQFRRAPASDLRQQLDDLERRFVTRGRGYSGNGYFDEVRTSLYEAEGWQSIENADFTRTLEVADFLMTTRPNTFNMTMRGLALLKLGRYTDAEIQLKAAIEQRPVSGYAYINLAWVFVSQARFREADETAVKGLLQKERVGAGSDEFVDVLAEAWAGEGLGPHNFRTVERLYRDLPGDPEIALLEARLWTLSGDFERSWSCLERARGMGLDQQRYSPVAAMIPPREQSISRVSQDT